MAMNVNESKQLDFDLNVEVSYPNDEGSEGNVEASDLNASASDDNNSDDSYPCSVCFDSLVIYNDDSPTLVTLKCGHKYHLDCIGSVFNARHLMQCPNCNQIEPGQWRYADDHPIAEEDWLADLLAEEVEDEEEKNIDLGIFTDLTWRMEFYPFTDLGQHHTCEFLSILSPTILFNEPGECIYAECLFTIPQSSASVGVSKNLSSQLTTGAGEVHNPNGLPVDPFLPPSNRPPIFPVNRLHSNRRIFWSVLEPGVIRGRHYLAHPFFDHSPLCRFDHSVINAPTAPYSGSSSVASSSFNNTSQVSSNLDELSAPVPHGHTRGISNSWSSSYGSNLVNENGSNRFNIWDHVPFLEPVQQHHIESEFYRFIYGDDVGESSSRGNENNSGGGNNNHGGNGGDDDGSNSFGGNAGGGSGDGNGISGGGTS